MRRSLLWLVMAFVLGFARLTHAADAPQALQIVTADLPPFAIEGNPNRPGLHVEIVEQVLQRAGQPVKAAFYPWVRAIAITKHTPRTAILPLTRTPEREPHYKWLMKLDTQHFVFINRSEDAPITTLEQARKLQIVILRGSPNLAQLLNRQFAETQIIQVARVEEMLRAVERGLADALYGGDVINMAKIRSSGRNPANFRIGMRVESADMWLAGGKGFDEAEQLAWQQAYDSMAKDGTLARLYRVYQVPMP
ncbi:substrate-binding periplasmic protein [Pseudoduganella namucuonensis]|uniref:Amino acid ABC transporter substrate-binding protein, PAAT family n=1 Tax=Pseudoduganella namucuonensis TaxID=1035707 RepID=A0A1I7KWG3_9BURK|nr:transporter substrate-binding domain-containing protein [Pseudoduganella namucuonensis]SFV01708.1 amino acid ABC transporter substrate-binding protein, PAAT family [Pseudoduganella namucuonensis]